jgi:nucleolin
MQNLYICIGLPFTAKEEDVKDFFASINDEILSIRLPRWHDSGRLRGYGHVEFASEEGAKAALDLNGNFAAIIIYYSPFTFSSIR